MSKDLKEKAIKLKGKDYVLVKDRVIYFNDTYKNGSITTAILTDPLSDVIVLRASVTPDVSVPQRVFTGYSQEVVGKGHVNTTSALENAETSAVGRALAMMGIGVIDSIASIDEINKAENRPTSTQKSTGDVTQNIQPIEIDGVSWKWIEGVSKKTGKPYKGWVDGNRGWMSNAEMQTAKKKYEERVAKELDDTSLDDLPF